MSDSKKALNELNMVLSLNKTNDFDSLDYEYIIITK